MAGAIRITSMETFEDQSGDLQMILPSTTKRPINYWSVPRWWPSTERIIYEHCARVDNTSTGDSIYISSETAFPKILIEVDGSGTYTFDSDRTREHVDRIWVTSDFEAGDDYQCPLRGAAITKVGSDPTPPAPDPLAIAENMGANWVSGSTFEVGQTVEGKTAGFTGGVGTVIYRYRFSTRPTSSDAWTHLGWINTTNEKNSVFYTITEVGQLRLQSQAKDDVGTVNSNTGVKTISS